MPLPSWLVWYKKPEYRDIREYATAVSAGRRSLSPDGRGKNSIPPLLRLDRILENKTCSPMSLYDFHMYLKHIEFSEENLEFYVWYKNFARKYSNTPHPDKLQTTKHGSTLSVSKSFTGSDTSTAVLEPSSSDTDEKYVINGEDGDFTKDTLKRIEELIGPAGACSGGKCGMRKTTSSGDDTNVHTSCQDPRVAEVNAVINTYLVPGAPKELNIPPAMRNQALSELRGSSDPRPSSLKPIADHVYQLLRNCSHRNFVRLGVANGTFETVCVATALGIVLTVAGFVCILLRAFVPYIGAHSRWNAFASWPLWWIGLSLILSGLRGSCFFLLLFSRRQPLPWEQFDDDTSVAVKRTGIMKVLSKLMIFDRKMRVNDDHLRRLQHKIVLQSLSGGALFASTCVLVFVFLPIWSDTRS